MVGVKIFEKLLLTETANESIEIAFFIIGQINPDGNILAKEIFELYTRIFAEQVEFILKQAPQLLGGGHAVK